MLAQTKKTLTHFKLPEIEEMGIFIIGSHVYKKTSAIRGNRDETGWILVYQTSLFSLT